MNEQLSSCLWLLVHCSFVHCLHYVLWYNRFSFPAQSWASPDSAPVLPTVMVFDVAHPLMSKFLISDLPRLSALCCFKCLSCPLPCQYGLSVFPSNGCDVNIGLLLPWPTMHLQNPSLTFTPHNHDWLLRWRLPAVLRFHFLLAAIVAPYLAPCPVPIGRCLPVRCLWLTVLWGTV